MSAPADGGTALDQASRFARVAQLVKNHPLLTVGSVLGSVGTFVVGMTNVVGLFMGGGSAGIADPISAGDTSLPPGPRYEYVDVSDATGQISVEVPTVWADVPGNGWHTRDLSPIPDNTVIGPGLNAAPNVETWKDDLTTPGVFIGASRKILRTHSAKMILRSLRFDGCSSTASETYTTDDFTGEIVTWSCPDAPAEWRLLAATPTKSRSYLVYVQMKLVSSADVDAYNKILNTFEVEFAK